MAQAKKDNQVLVALIGAAGVVIAALIGHFGFPNWDGPPLGYTVEVKDATTHNPIIAATVNLAQDEKVPGTYPTDSRGVAYVPLQKDTKTVSLEVMASGYQSQTRKGLPAHLGSQEFLLESLPPPPGTKTPPGSGKTEAKPPNEPHASGGRTGNNHGPSPDASGPSAFSILIKGAQKHWSAGYRDEAVAEFLKASQLNPNDYLPHECLGFNFASKLDFDNAAKEYELAITDPNAPEKAVQQAKLVTQNRDRVNKALLLVRNFTVYANKHSQADAHFQLAALLYKLVPLGTGVRADEECNTALQLLEQDQLQHKFMVVDCHNAQMEVERARDYEEDCKGK
jgi:tetratricopeptide (TPR) repeat protein